MKSGRPITDPPWPSSRRLTLHVTAKDCLLHCAQSLMSDSNILQEGKGGDMLERRVSSLICGKKNMRNMMLISMADGRPRGLVDPFGDGVG